MRDALDARTTASGLPLFGNSTHGALAGTAARQPRLCSCHARSRPLRRPASSNHACLYPVIAEFRRKAATAAISHELYYLDWLLSNREVFRLALENRQMNVGSSRRNWESGYSHFPRATMAAMTAAATAVGMTVLRR